MKIEEIVQYLEMVRPPDNYNHTFSVSVENARHFGLGSQLNKDVNMAIDLAIQALEKQVPKKPIESEFTPLICPDCESKVILGQRYCENCGQRIDWEE